MIKKVYEIRDITNDEVYYSTAVFDDLEKAKIAIDKNPEEFMSEHSEDDDYEIIKFSVITRDLNKPQDSYYFGNGYTVEFERKYADEDSDDYVFNKILEETNE